MCPLMTSTDRKDCLKFFSLQKAPVVEETAAVYSEGQLNIMKQIFDFFDADHSGTVDRKEIKHAMKDTKPKFNSQESLRGSGIADSVGVTDGAIDNIVDEGDADGNDGLDFEEFVSTFGDFFLSK